MIGPAVGGGLLGGLAMLVLLILYMGTEGMGYATPMNVALAAWFFPIRPPAAMMPMLMRSMGPMAKAHPQMMQAMMALKTGHASNATVATLMSHMPPALRSTVMSKMPLSDPHLAVGLVIHFAFAAATGVVFAAILVTLVWLRVPVVRHPLGLVGASVIGGGLLFLIMDFGILPLLNPIMAMAPTAAFLGAHLAYGLGVGVVVAWALFPHHAAKALPPAPVSFGPAPG
ncbi:MAG: hypothetical protein ACRDZQ_09170 [Acidimicrobiales bacterium]